MSDAFDLAIWDKAKSHAVDPSLIKAIVAAESNFNPRAYRHEPRVNDASYGLMQILFKTAQWMGYRGTPEGLYDPETNIEFGTRYLKWQLVRYHGTVEAAVAAYNSGTAYKTSAGTFTNQRYVNRVMGFFERYRRARESQASTGIHLRSDLPQIGPVPTSSFQAVAAPAGPTFNLEGIFSEENAPWLIALGSAALLAVLSSRR